MFLSASRCFQDLWCSTGMPWRRRRRRSVWKCSGTVDICLTTTTAPQVTTRSARRLTGGSVTWAAFRFMYIFIHGSSEVL